MIETRKVVGFGPPDVCPLVAGRVIDYDKEVLMAPIGLAVNDARLVEMKTIQRLRGLFESRLRKRACSHFPKGAGATCREFDSGANLRELLHTLDAGSNSEKVTHVHMPTTVVPLQQERLITCTVIHLTTGVDHEAVNGAGRGATSVIISERERISLILVWV